MRDLRRIRGGEELIAAVGENPSDSDDYIHAVLTGPDVLDPAARLRMVYPNLLHVEIEQRGRELMSGLNMTRWNIKPRTNCLRISLCMSTAEGLTTTSGR